MFSSRLRRVYQSGDGLRNAIDLSRSFGLVNFLLTIQDGGIETACVCLSPESESDMVALDLAV